MNKIVLIILAAVAGTLVVVAFAYFILKIPIIVNTINSLLGKVTTGPYDKVVTAVAAGGAVATAATSALNKAKSAASTANTQLQNAKGQLQSATSQVADVKSAAEAKVADFKLQAEAAEATAKSATDEAISLQSQVKNSRDQLQAVKDQNTQFVKDLASAANGALVSNPLDGKIYSVLKLAPEIQVR